MDKKTKTIFKIGLVLILLTIVITYYNIFIRHNYFVDIEVSCDPSLEFCFVGDCDSSVDDTCINNKYSYKLIEKKAYSAMQCQEGDEDCLSCKENETKCKVINCDPKNNDEICTTMN